MPDADQQRGDIRDRLDRLDSRLKFEFELVNHRLSWLISSNAFMLCAFAIALNHTAHSATGYNADSLTIAISLIMPILGLVSCSLVWYGIQAAHTVISRIKDLRVPLEEQAYELYGLDRSSVASDDIVHMTGNAVPFWIPIILFLAWAYLLYVRLS